MYLFTWRSSSSFLTIVSTRGPTLRELHLETATVYEKLDLNNLDKERHEKSIIVDHLFGRFVAILKCEK